MFDPIADAAAVVAIITSIVGLGYSRRSDRKSDRADEKAERALDVQLQQHHAGMTPIFEVTWTPQSFGGGGSGFSILEVKLDGPADTDELESVEIFIRNDRVRE